MIILGGKCITHEKFKKSLSVKNPRFVASLIADSLFQNGDRKNAERLVLVDRKGRDLGGWCKQAVIDQIEIHLNVYKHEHSDK